MMVMYASQPDGRTRFTVDFESGSGILENCDVRTPFLTLCHPLTDIRLLSLSLSLRSSQTDVYEQISNDCNLSCIIIRMPATHPIIRRCAIHNGGQVRTHSPFLCALLCAQCGVLLWERVTATIEDNDVSPSAAAVLSRTPDCGCAYCCCCVYLHIYYNIPV
jgi:hypothetical protein